MCRSCSPSSGLMALAAHAEPTYSRGLAGSNSGLSDPSTPLPACPLHHVTPDLHHSKGLITPLQVALGGQLISFDCFDSAFWLRILGSFDHFEIH